MLPSLDYAVTILAGILLILCPRHGSFFGAFAFWMGVLLVLYSLIAPNVVAWMSSKAERAERVREQSILAEMEQASHESN